MIYKSQPEPAAAWPESRVRFFLLFNAIDKKPPRFYTYTRRGTYVHRHECPGTIATYRAFSRSVKQFKVSLRTMQPRYAVGLHAPCCNNWYRNNSPPFLPLCGHSAKIRTRVYRLLPAARLCASACSAREKRSSLSACLPVSLPVPARRPARSRCTAIVRDVAVARLLCFDSCFFAKLKAAFYDKYRNCLRVIATITVPEILAFLTRRTLCARSRPAMFS